jgi:hypothetical protein
VSKPAFAEQDGKKGVICCETFNPFTGWVYAHADDRLTFVCPKCGAKKRITKSAL